MRRAAPLLVTAALALTGCGGDSLTAAQLSTRASAICARTAAATDRVALPNGPAQGGRFLRRGLAYMRPAHAELRALKPPAGLRARYERAVQLGGREVELIARHADAIAGGDDVIASYRRLDAALETLVRQENAYWRGLEIPACVRR